MFEWLTIECYYLVGDFKGSAARCAGCWLVLEVDLVNLSAKVRLKSRTIKSKSMSGMIQMC